MIKVNVKDVLATVSEATIKSYDKAGAAALEKVQNGTGAGNDFLGWVNLPRRHPHH